jgi:secondary thiamine-phosphate synthase enzyme
MRWFELSTKGPDSLTDVTHQVQQTVAEYGVAQGFCLVYCPHTTAAITINENADPDVQRDLLVALDRAVPQEGGFHHAEGNSAAHAKSTLVGASCLIPIDEGKLVLGTWQAVFFCEFDGPRRRKFAVQVIGTSQASRV